MDLLQSVFFFLCALLALKSVLVGSDFRFDLLIRYGRKYLIWRRKQSVFNMNQTKDFIAARKVENAAFAVQCSYGERTDQCPYTDKPTED